MLLTEPLAIAALASFILAVIGTIIVRFWIIPIRRYLSVKRRVTGHLSWYGTGGDCNEWKNESRKEHDKRTTELRQLSARLSACYNEDLPHWYRMILANRDESPIDAARHLMALANTRDIRHAMNRVEKVRKHINLKKTGRTAL